jgi:hypothetical protein
MARPGHARQSVIGIVRGGLPAWFGFRFGLGFRGASGARLLPVALPSVDHILHIREVFLDGLLILARDSIPADGVAGVPLSGGHDLRELGRHVTFDLLSIDKELANDGSLGGFHFAALGFEVDRGLLCPSGPYRRLAPCLGPAGPDRIRHLSKNSGC